MTSIVLFLQTALFLEVGVRDRKGVLQRELDLFEGLILNDGGTGL